jgi:two-component system phosphate regulon sensor histidine kinase PhoR
MPTSTTQLQFAAELALFVTVVSGLAFALRPGLLNPTVAGRALLAAGFTCIAAVAFVHGSQLVDRDDQGLALASLRIAGAALVALGSVGWLPRSRGRLALWAGLGLLVVAEVVAPSHGRVADLLVALGAVGIGAALVTAGRRSIPARIGNNAAFLLLLVVLALSVTLSVVLTDNVEDEALRRYGNRTNTEAAEVIDAAEASLRPAQVVGGLLSSSRAGELLRLNDDTTSEEQLLIDRQKVAESLRYYASDQVLAIEDPLLFARPVQGPGGTVASVQAVSAPVDNATVLSITGTDVVTEAVRNRGRRQGVTVRGEHAFAVAATPVRINPPGDVRPFVGVVVIARRLDETYVRQQEADTAGESLEFTLATPTAVVARSGREPEDAVLLDAAREVVENGRERVSRTVEDRFVVARPVAEGDALAQLAVITTVPTTVVADAREALFRTLFLVALGASLVALLLAFFAGERIGGGLRRLTAAADRIRAGQLHVRARVRSEDELGVLSGAFNAMAGSIATMTGELRLAADDEARLRGRLETVIAGMGEALVAVGPSGQVTDFNQAAGDLLGLATEDAIGQPIDAVVRLVGTDGQETPVLEVPSAGLRSVEGFVAGPDETAVPVLISSALLRDHDGRAAGAVYVLRDVRREHEVEQMKTAILANISHELRTPLTPIKGYAGVLQRKKVDPDQAARFATEISAGVDQLERVIGQLVNFATFAAGRLALRPGPVPLNEVVDDAVDRWQRRADDRHRVVGRVGVPPPVMLADRQYLDQAIDELVDNAIKYSPGGGEVTVAASTENGDGRAKVRLSVTDTGEGIEPERLQSLVADFAQGDRSSTRRFGGLGLGLTLVDRIVRAHGGELQCRSTPGRGARFSIVLPVNEGARVGQEP